MFEALEQPSAGHRLAADLAWMRQGLAQAAGCSTLSMTRGQAEAAITVAHQLKNQLEALYLSLLVVRENTVPEAGGTHANTAAWAADALRLTRGQAGRDVEAAYVIAGDVSPGARGRRHAGRLPSLGGALAAGEVSREHVDVAVRTVKDLPRQLLKTRGGDVDRVLAEHAVAFCPKDAATLAAHLLSVIAPEGLAAGGDGDAVERREAAVGVARDGAVCFQGRLDPAQGAEVKTVWDHFADPTRFRDEHGNPLSMTRGERYADAMVEIFRLAVAAAAAGHPAGEGPRVTIITTAEQLTHTPTPGGGPGKRSEAPGEGGEGSGERGEGSGEGVPAWCSGGRTAGFATCEATGVLSPKTLHTLACDATMERVVLDKHGAVARLETIGRPATRAMRRALAARDGGCAFPGCSAPASWCDAHHVVFWSRGGLTVIENLALLCRRHHTVIHQERWVITMVEGVPWFTPPEAVDATRTPRRNTVHVEIGHARKVGQALLTGQPLPERPPPPDVLRRSETGEGDAGEDGAGESARDGPAVAGRPPLTSAAITPATRGS